MRMAATGLLALALAAPAPALGAAPGFLHVWLRSQADFICVDTGTSDPVTFTLKNPDGQTIESVAASKPDTDTGACRASSDPGAVGNVAEFTSGYAPAAVVTATQAGRVVA